MADQNGKEDMLTPQEKALVWQLVLRGRGPKDETIESVSYKVQTAVEKYCQAITKVKL